MSKSPVCKQHGETLRWFPKERSDADDTSPGGFLGCPHYGECGSYYCTSGKNMGQVVQSKRLSNEGDER